MAIGTAGDFKMDDDTLVCERGRTENENIPGGSNKEAGRRELKAYPCNL